MDPIKIEEWIVVVAGERSFLGVPRYSGRPFHKMSFSDIRRDSSAPIVPLPMALQPVFELATFHESTSSRRALVTPVDFLVHGAPLYVEARVFYLCEDMHEDDRRTYQKLVENGMQVLAKAKARASGLVVPP
jgi:hypothetical protein